MAELKVGGFKSQKPSGQNYDFDLDEKEIDISGNAPDPEEGNEPKPINEPEGGDLDITGQEPDDSEPNGKDTEPKPNENEDGKDPSPDSSLKPNEPNPVDPEKEIQINDESALKYLSEKLGKEINSFDELSKPESKNPLEEDPYMKELYEWRKKTGRPIEDWIKYQKDYTSLSDLDVARELLQHEYPNFNEEEVELELSRFQTSDDDFDGDSKMKQLELKKYATRGRKVLGELKSDLGEPTSIQNLPKEVQENVALAKQIKEQYTTQQKQQEEYTNRIKEVANKTENFEIPLTDDLKLNYKISEENRKKLPEMINNMPHWKNKDGSWNHQAVINDAVKIFQFDDMMKLAFEQGISKGKDSLISDTSNSTLGEGTSKGAKQVSKTNDVEIEGFDNLIGGKGMKVRF